MLLGNVLDIGTPSDATVTNAKTNFTSTSSAAGLQIKGDGTTDGTLQLNCSQNSHGIKLASPAHSAGQSYKLIFPSGNVTAGKFLKVDSVSGSGTTGIGTMTFADGGGRYTLINRTTISGGTSYIDLTDVMTDTYENYLLVGSEINFATDGADIHFQVITSAGVQTGGSDYNWAYMQRESSSNDVDVSRSTASDVYRINHSGVGNASNETANFSVHIFDARATGKTTIFRGEQVAVGTGSDSLLNLSVGRYLSNGAITGIRFKASSGNINSGTLTFYGANG
tara:strand:+ start:6 stop:848 length:843 start_codon:yes stop_codon:yes gene_type:complete